jgi:hypothetical protein
MRALWHAACPFVYLYVRVDAWMDECLAGASTVGRTLFIFSIQEFIHPGSVPDESGDCKSKNSCPSDGLRNRRRLKRLCVNVSISWRPSSKRKLHTWYPNNNVSGARGAKAKCQHSKAGFTGQSYLMTLQYSIPNNGLQSNNRFPLQDNAVKVIHI